MENVSQLSNLPARLKRPPKLPSSHETRREWFPTRQNVLAPVIVLRLLGKLQKLSRLQAMHTKLQTAKLTVSHPHRMTHSSRTSTGRVGPRRVRSIGTIVARPTNFSKLAEAGDTHPTEPKAMQRRSKNGKPDLAFTAPLRVKQASQSVPV